MKAVTKIIFFDENNEKFFGEGPYRLLCTIEETGSLRSAAASMGLAYTKALRMIRNAEKALGFPLTWRSTGGKSGGGSTLTPEGKEWLKKYEQYHGKGHWHFIGTLQKNKVKYIIDKVTLIHAVDRYSLLKEIEKQAAKRDLEMPVLIQVNIAKEESKHGFEVEEIDEVFNCLKDYPHVKVRGLMMMAPHIESSETEKYFKMTQELLQRLQKDYPMYQLDQLSMGMSNDYHEALNHGSTMIRIGSALFK